ncbi:MAG TPA: phage portal protein, partial [Acidimicrobiia bacterium]|nr:phage portal protein [Acidimicrobiia bacterium]
LVSMPVPPVSLSTNPQIRRVEVLAQQLADANSYYDKFDRYYSGDQPLAFLAPEIRAQVGNRLASLVINWPETIVDSVNRRLTGEGFLLGQGGEADEELWRLWTANEMHQDAPLGQVDALVHGLAFISVWPSDEDPATPLMAFESAHEVACSYVPGSGDRVLRDVIKRWVEDDDRDVLRVNLYTPDLVFKYRSSAQAWGAAQASSS